MDEDDNFFVIIYRVSKIKDIIGQMQVNWWDYFHKNFP